MNLLPFILGQATQPENGVDPASGFAYGASPWAFWVFGFAIGLTLSILFYFWIAGSMVGWKKVVQDL